MNGKTRALAIMRLAHQFVDDCKSIATDLSAQTAMDLMRHAMQLRDSVEPSLTLFPTKSYAIINGTTMRLWVSCCGSASAWIAAVRAPDHWQVTKDLQSIPNQQQVAADHALRSQMVAADPSRN